MTQGSGKVRGVAKGIRKTTSRFGARLEPFTHVNLMLYRGRGSLDTITQAEIIAPHRAIRDDLALFAAGETMLEAVDRVAEEHERNVRLVLLLLSGLRSLETTAGRSGGRRRVLPAEAPVHLRLPSEPHGVRRLRQHRRPAVLRRARRRRLRRRRRARRRPRHGRGARVPRRARARRPRRRRRHRRARAAHAQGGEGTPVRLRGVPPRAPDEVGPDAREDGDVSSYPPRPRPRSHPGTRRDRDGRQRTVGRATRPAAGPRATARGRRPSGTRSREPSQVRLRG